LRILLTVEVSEKLEGMVSADQEGLRDFKDTVLGERRGGRFFCLLVGLFIVLLPLFSLVRTTDRLSAVERRVSS
jgi:hypothetical protein